MRFFLILFVVFSSSLHGADRPNIVFFVADDLGQRDLAVYGSTFYETPNLDRLAAEGMLFTDAYASCPVCSPTRASLMTGRWAQRTGVSDYIGAPLIPDQWKRNTKLLPAPCVDRLAHDETTFAEVLKEVGYATFFAGKWHLGPEGWWPEDQGFDVNFGGIDLGGPYGGGKYFSPYDNPRLEDGPEGEHLPDRLAAEASRFIEAKREQPFLVYYPFYDVHVPLRGREDLVKKYVEKRRHLGIEEKWGREGERDVRLVQEHVVYAAMVEAMDLAVGRVLDKLDELDLREKTLVLFTSDNGGLSTSEGWPTSNVPWRAGKGWTYEGGIRVPLIVRWPGVVEAGSVSGTPVISPDFFPTFLDVVGLDKAERIAVDGQSLLPVFKGGSLPERSLFWHYPHYANQGGAPSAAIRQGRHKLIHWFEDDNLELFDLAADPGETKDMSLDRPDLVDSLSGDLKAWQEEVGAEFPTPNPNYDPNEPSGRASVRKK